MTFRESRRAVMKRLRREHVSTGCIARRIEVINDSAVYFLAHDGVYRARSLEAAGAAAPVRENQPRPESTF